MSSADENLDEISENKEENTTNSSYPDVDDAQTDSELLDLLDSVLEEEETDSGLKNPSMENDFEMGEEPEEDLIDIFNTEETEESGMEEEPEETDTVQEDLIDIFNTGETEESGMEEDTDSEETDGLEPEESGMEEDTDIENQDLFRTEETEESGMEEDTEDVDIFGTGETEDSGMEEDLEDIDIFGTEETEESGMEEETDSGDFDIFGTGEPEESGMEEEPDSGDEDLFGMEETEESGMEEEQGPADLLEEAGLDKKALEEQFEFISEDGGTIEDVEIRDETQTKPEKKSFFSKIFQKLFPKKEKISHPETETLDEENAGIIKEIEEEEPDQPVEPVKEPEKRKKQKKSKKSKKSAETAAEEGEGEEQKGKKKPKKEKKPKEKKEKKPKKPKEPEEPSMPLPKLPVIIIFVLCISFGGFLVLGQKMTFYGSTINKAKECFIYQDYQGAYEHLMGIQLKEADQDFYDQVVMMQKMNQSYESYLIYIELGEYDEALNELVYAVKDYDKDLARVKELGIETEYSAIFDQIKSSLQNIFDSTLEDARSLYQIESQKEYTLAIRSKIQELGFGAFEELDPGQSSSVEEEQAKAEASAAE